MAIQKWDYAYIYVAHGEFRSPFMQEPFKTPPSPPRPGSRRRTAYHRAWS
jgi:hypothetical protein